MTVPFRRIMRAGQRTVHRLCNKELWNLTRWRVRYKIFVDIHHIINCSYRFQYRTYWQKPNPKTALCLDRLLSYWLLLTYWKIRICVYIYTLSWGQNDFELGAKRLWVGGKMTGGEMTRGWHDRIPSGISFRLDPFMCIPSKVLWKDSQKLLWEWNSLQQSIWL